MAKSTAWGTAVARYACFTMYAGSDSASSIDLHSTIHEQILQKSIEVDVTSRFNNEEKTEARSPWPSRPVLWKDTRKNNEKKGSQSKRHKLVIYGDIWWQYFNWILKVTIPFSMHNILIILIYIHIYNIYIYINLSARQMWAKSSSAQFNTCALLCNLACMAVLDWAHDHPSNCMFRVGGPCL